MTMINTIQQARFQIFMKKLAAVDDTLEELGTSKIYQKMHIWSKRVVIAWIVYILASNSYDTLWWINREKIAFWIFIFPYIGNYCIHANEFVDIIFVTFLWYINNRFDKVNEHMQYLLMKEQHGLRNKWKKLIINGYRNTSHTDKQVLWTLMHLHLELCHIARELNRMFGMQMALEMASYLFFLTSLCHYLYAMITEKVQEEAQVTACKIIYQLISIFRYTNIRKEIYLFALQIMHRPLRFTGMGLFYFGNNFLRKFCMKIVTFMIIILQMSGD
ncbi:uncharacterized protein LOC126857777 [Cataglyphis hispanica]|uniref:uncharacterized protein LOC126857777 n=1 Tax=Cataglyphis hispanica TaxID=1086592 RepID=UPI00217FC3C5|nr:uncharacterized protein LOC126857777 [Cataglyphis hispanica]